jgi:hypothetical protein
MSNQTITLDLEIGALLYGYIKDIERLCFKYGIQFSCKHDGGIVSRTYTIKMTSDDKSTYSAQHMKNSIIKQIQSME